MSWKSGLGLGFLRGLLRELPWSERAEIEETHHLDLPPERVFRVHNSNGRTQIRGEERSDIQVIAQKSARAESADAAAGLIENMKLNFGETSGRLDLDVDVPRKWNRRGSVNLCIALPRDMEVWVAGNNGRVSVEGIRGTVRARSTNGSASVCDIVGDVDVATTNARVSCSCICGALSARSSNGKIEIDRHSGSVDASTSNGLIRAKIEEIGQEGIQLATSNGRIVLDLPEAIDVDVDLRVDNGLIRNDRELCHKGKETHGRVTGRIGAGGKLIKLRTSNGSITLH